MSCRGALHFLFLLKEISENLAPNEEEEEEEGVFSLAERDKTAITFGVL